MAEIGDKQYIIRVKESADSAEDLYYFYELALLHDNDAENDEEKNRILTNYQTFYEGKHVTVE